MLLLACGRIAAADPAVPVADPAPIIDPAPARWAKPVAAASVAVTWGAATTWAYFAWFRGKDYDGSRITFGGLGASSYAGGADKLGHVWASYALSRMTTGILVEGGWPRLSSSLVATGLAELFFTLSEIEDMLLYQFEVGDEIANLLGGGLAIAMVNVPALDRLLDFRLEYFPSPEYRRRVRRDHDIDFAQDYSGQSYMLALHVDALPLQQPRWLEWTDYLDVVVGFQTRNYEPMPDPPATPRQELYVGVAIDMQHVLGRLFCPSTGRRIGDGVLEHLAVPFTTLRGNVAARSP